MYLVNSKHHIYIDMGFGYWQAIVRKASHTKLVIFGVNEKLAWKKMPMGDQNTAPAFVSMMVVLHSDC